jgi:uncharacterized protein YegP (UPF0339 family)
MAGKIEIRQSGEKFRFVVLNRNGEKLLQSGQFDDKPGTKRAASSLAKAVSGAEIVDATKPATTAVKSSARRPRTKRYAATTSTPTRRRSLRVVNTAGVNRDGRPASESVSPEAPRLRALHIAALRAQAEPCVQGQSQTSCVAGWRV